MGANVKHKDSVFSQLFGNPDSLRRLYSAIQGIDLPADVPIDINTIRSALFMGRVNDISFTVDDRLVVLIEHQSGINHNMPLRLLMYIGRIYEKIADRRNIYQRALEKVPYPIFIVLYNGKAPYPDHRILKLSDAFKDAGDLRTLTGDGPPLELVVQVYNINEGHNLGLAAKCKELADYSFLIAKLREYGKTMTPDEAMEAAVRYCMENDVLREFLEKHGTEVINMLLEEWKIEDAQEAWYEEGIEKGREEGLEAGVEKTARNALAKGLSLELICEITGLDMETVAGLQAGVQ
ncbi:MAG: Rpn family recombination-promoting nuclease/putative transposase [Treponema sp.]|nr:Rpn family recombination-promoting nuclease/putative transposase [Treponema sp.]